MNILVVSYCYPPLRYPRSIQVARLVAHMPADELTVVCGAEVGAQDSSLLAAYPDAPPRVIRVPWSPATNAYRQVRTRLLGPRVLVPDVYRPWQRDAARAIQRHRLLDRVGVLVTFGQPMSDHLLGLRLARHSDLTWIAHFSDPWVDSAFRTGGRPTRRMNARLEGDVLARADAVVFTSDETLELVAERYPAALHSKLHVLPHAYDPKLYPPVGVRSNGVVARYIGNFYGHRGPRPLLQALRLLAERQPGILRDVRIEFVGQRESPVPPELLKGLPDGCVSFRPPVDYLESLALMRSSDLLLVLDAPASRSVFLPSKLVEYLGAGPPILALTPEGTAARLVRRMGGWQADPTDATGAANALAASLDTVRRRPTPVDRRDDLIREYRADRVGARFLDLLRDVAQG